MSDVSESAQDVVESRPVRLLGRAGLLAYAGVHLVFAAVIVLLVVAAATYDPKKPTTLDAGLRAVAEEPYGAPLIFALTSGLVACGATASSTRGTARHEWGSGGGPQGSVEADALRIGANAVRGVDGAVVARPVVPLRAPRRHREVGPSVGHPE
jgi:Domain of Unknown Function (DUF1206)